MTSPAPWRNWDQTVTRSLYGSESNLSWYKGYWPKGSFSGHQRLEPGSWPPGPHNSPFDNAYIPESGSLKCDRNNPCPWGGKDNEGVLVMQNGVPTRRGMCIRGVCDCPVGQDGPFCSGQAHRSATGEVVWPNSQLGVPTYDPYQAAFDQW